MHDPLIMSGRGGIPLNMAKPARMQEPGHAAEAFERLDIPVLGTLEGDAYADGGDRFWLDDTTARDRPRLPHEPQGRAARCRRCWSPRASTSRPTTCRTTRAPRTCCTCSRSCRRRPRSLFVVYEPLAPVRLLQDIQARGIEWIAIDHDSYHAMGCNILAVRPGVVVMVDGVPDGAQGAGGQGRRGPHLRRLDLSLKGDGGPTCLTAPLLQSLSYFLTG